MLSPKIIEFALKKILNFCTQKKEMGWVVSTLALSKHSWMSSQMQWVSELTVPGQLSTIESRGTVWGTHGNAAKSASCSIDSAGPGQMRPPNHPQQGRLIRTLCWFGWNCQFSYIF